MTTWLVTSTFYGQWLPGHTRGSITNVRDRRPDDRNSKSRVEHANPGDEFEESMPGLEHAARQNLKSQPVALDLAQAEQLLEQFIETAKYRSWELLAVSIMYNHVHVVIAAPAEVGKAQIPRDLKSYGARRLNKLFGKPQSGTWWSDSGSCRPRRASAVAVFYVCHGQPRPLLVWSGARGRIPPEKSDPSNVFETE